MVAPLRRLPARVPFSNQSGRLGVSGWSARTTHPRPLFDNCRECGGTGVRVISLAGGNVSQGQNNKPSGVEEKRDCETCHGLGRVRRILYR